MTISSDSGRARLAMAGILVCAAALRFWALGAGIPYGIGIDEPQVLNRSLIMMRSGDFNPHFFDYPTLYIYLQLAVACVRFMTGALMGDWTSLSEASLPDFVLWGRALTASLGTLTVLIVYRIGLRWSVRHALLAAGLMAVMPMHVRESHFILTDVPLTFFVALTFLLSLRASERHDLPAFALAGAAAGLAAATKYPGALALLLPLVAAGMTREARPSRGAAAAAAVAVSAAAFLIAAPYTLLDLPAFLNGFGRLMGSYTGPSPAEPGWVTYVKHLRRGMGWPAFVAVQVGCVLACTRALRGPGRLPWTLALAFPLLYFFFVSRQTLIFGRYLLPILPFVSILTAAAVIAAAGMLPKIPMRRQLRAAVVVLLTALAAVPPALTAIAFNRLQARTSTAALAYAWIRANVPEGERIAVEGTDLDLSFSGYSLQRLAQLRRLAYDMYVERGTRYLVASSQCYGPYLAQPRHFPSEYADYVNLFARTEEVARFAPSDLHPGPELRILKVAP